MYVTATKAIDGLFGVANQKQCGCEVGGVCVLGITKDVMKDAPLGHVGILKFIDKGHAVLLAQGAHQGEAMRAIQCLGDMLNQIIVGLYATLAFECGKAEAGCGTQAMQAT